MNKKNQDLLGVMDVKSALIKLSIPATIGMIVNALYNLVDTLFVGWGEGEIAIGGLTLAFPIQMIVVAVALMIGIGGASVFSRAYGSKNYEKMDQTVNTAVRFGVMVSFLLAVVCTFFLEELLMFFGATSGNIDYGVDYLSIILIGITFQTVSMIMNNFTRAEGRAQIAMKAMVLGTGLNIILDPFFIFKEINLFGLVIPLLGLGVRGAATATVISQFTAFAYITRRAFDKESALNIKLQNFFSLNIEALKDIVKIGLPTFVRNSIGAILSILVLKTINEFAGMYIEEYTTIYGIINRVIFFVFMPGFGLVQGLAPIAGYNYGAKQYDRLITVIKYAMKLMFIYFLLAFIFVQLASPLIFDIFSKNDDPFIIETGSRVFKIITMGLLLVSFQIIMGAVYQAFGYAKRAFAVALLRQFIFFVPIWIILIQLYDLDGLWYSFFLADILSGIVSIFMLRHELRALTNSLDII